MFEIGNSLREARRARSWTSPSSRPGTKIRAKYLRALEDENFEALPSATYVKGFLRTYANYLGLDGQLYVDEYNVRYGSGDEVLERRVRSSSPAFAGRSRGAGAGLRRKVGLARARRDRGRDRARDPAWRTGAARKQNLPLSAPAVEAVAHAGRAYSSRRRAATRS